jgi:hypothetical protein
MEEPGAPKEKEPSKDPSGGRPEAKKPVNPESLSPEEQMEKYEEDLKENDWGHQPC